MASWRRCISSASSSQNRPMDRQRRTSRPSQGVPVAVLVGIGAFALLSRTVEDTGPVDMPARELTARQELVCRALVSQLPDTVRDLEYWLNDYGFTTAWNTSRGEGVTVAVIDTGVNGEVAELKGAVTGGTDVSGLGSPDGQTPVGEDPNHGTMVASLLAGRGTGNGNGVIGIALGAYLAYRSGDAKDFYLPGILLTLGQAVLLVVSVVFRKPIIGYVWAVMANKGKHDWLQNPALFRTFQWLTLAWAGSLVFRGGSQGLLYLADQGDLIGIVRIVVSWPMYAAMLFLTVWAVRRVQRTQEPELDGVGA